MSDRLRIQDLGRLAYGPALEVQRRVNQAVIDGEADPTLLLVEHDPVVTVSRRRTASEHLLAGAEELDRLGIDLQPTDRGGDVTYHGPGQLVAYPILPLRPMGLSVVSYMRWLEGVAIEAVSRFGVRGERVEGCTGVWVGGAKLAALGVRVRRGVAMHGLSLNVDPDLSHYHVIVPCGLHKPVTSLRQLLGEQCPGMPEVKARLTEVIQNAFAASVPRPVASSAGPRLPHRKTDPPQNR